MSEIIELKGNYITVRRKENGEKTYGGDQGFFKSESKENRKYQCGCGIIAFSDLLLYLASRNKGYCIAENKDYINRELSEENYKEYFNRIYCFCNGIPFQSGVSFLKLWHKFNRIARRNKWKLRACWGFSGKKIFNRIEEMLEKDIPVILCIPYMVRRKDKKDKLSLYKRYGNTDGGKPFYKKEQETNAHYVMITGYVQEEEETYYKISSWGKEYFINKREYDGYMNTHFLGKLLGNILYIR